MSNAIVAQSINRTTVGHALRIMRREYAHNASALRALNTAEVELSLAPWVFDGETLVLESRTNIGHKYTITAAGCDGSCKARGAHWHQQAYELLVRAGRIATQPAKSRMTEEQYAKALELVDDLY
ncbi:MAG: hypothetical protein M3R24_26415 [Chloroflexota bacterium]|nr:hypothetical protein [Chloroflexota bacterium]